MAQGYNLKNRSIEGQSVKLPVGTAAERPATPEAGMTRFNTTNASLEFYDGTSWNTLTISGLVDVVVDTFTGDGSTTVFGSMTNRVTDATDALVFVGGVYQTPTNDYTTDGSYDITFTSAVPNNVEINVIHNLNSTTVS